MARAWLFSFVRCFAQNSTIYKEAQGGGGSVLNLVIHNSTFPDKTRLKTPGSCCSILDIVAYKFLLSSDILPAFHK